MCIADIHLYSTFGLSFQKDSIDLKHKFFKHLVDTKMLCRNRSTNDLSCYLKVPLLLTNATFNPRLVSLMDSMTGIKIPWEKYFWSSQDQIARRNIKMSLLFITQTTRYIKTVLDNSLSNNVDEKYIVYTNTDSCLNQ